MPHVEVRTVLLVMCGTQLYDEGVSPTTGGALATFEGQTMESRHVFIDGIIRP